jgi:hypothetical protein
VLLTFLSRYLCTIGHLECLALGSGLPGFTQDFSGPTLLGCCFQPEHAVSSTGLSPSMVHPSREIRLPHAFLTGRLVLHPVQSSPTTPLIHRCKAIAYKRFRLIPFRSPLLRESHSLSSPPLTEMFQFSGLPHPTLCVQMGVPGHDSWRVAPFGNLRLSLLAANRSVSLLATPFIGSRCQGIHRAPFLT